MNRTDYLIVNHDPRACGMADGGYHLKIDSKNGRLVASVLLPMGGATNPDRISEGEATANLLSKMPELYRALNELKSEYDEFIMEVRVLPRKSRLRKKVDKLLEEIELFYDKF